MAPVPGSRPYIHCLHSIPLVQILSHGTDSSATQQWLRANHFGAANLSEEVLPASICRLVTGASICDVSLRKTCRHIIIPRKQTYSHQQELGPPWWSLVLGRILGFRLIQHKSYATPSLQDEKKMHTESIQIALDYSSSIPLPSLSSALHSNVISNSNGLLKGAGLFSTLMLAMLTRDMVIGRGTREQRAECASPSVLNSRVTSMDQWLLRKCAYFPGSNTADISPFQHINYTTLRFLGEVAVICDDVFQSMTNNSSESVSQFALRKQQSNRWKPFDTAVLITALSVHYNSASAILQRLLETLLRVNHYFICVHSPLRMIAIVNRCTVDIDVVSAMALCNIKMQKAHCIRQRAL